MEGWDGETGKGQDGVLRPQTVWLFQTTRMGGVITRDSEIFPRTATETPRAVIAVVPQTCKK